MQTKSLRAFIKSLIIGAAPAVLVYYALRGFGFVQYLALIGAIVVSLAQTLFGLVRSRKLDPVSGGVLVLAGCALAVALTTKNPRATQVADTVPGVLLSTAFLVSSAMRRPLTRMAAGIAAPGLAAQALPERGWTPQDELDWTAMHVRLSAFCGVFGLCQTAFSLAMIFVCEVDISQAVIVTVGTSTTILLLVYAVNWVRKFIKDRDLRAEARLTADHSEGERRLR